MMIDISCDVLVAGAGHAGMAAALFAARKGLKVVQTGTTGGIDFGSGFIDVLGVHPTADLMEHDDPWKGMENLADTLPAHPYAFVSPADIRGSILEFTDFLGEQGVPFGGRDDRNVRLLTPAGTIKRTYLAPKSMLTGADALADGAPCLVVSFDGLKGFSGRQIMDTIGERWPALRSAAIAFPGLEGELFPEHMAHALSDPDRRKALAETVKKHLSNEHFVAFPAMLGILDSTEVIDHLSSLLGRPVFEIPTLPPPIMGVRLRSAFDRGLPGLGVRTLSQKTVLTAAATPEGFVCTVGGSRGEYNVTARSFILATGRFFGKGLRQEMYGMREVIFNLPVTQPDSPDDWYNDRFFASQGHSADRSGILFDKNFRPLGEDHLPFHPALRAAGAILSGHDWIREKCGTGLAVATARKAVDSLAAQLAEER